MILQRIRFRMIINIHTISPALKSYKQLPRNILPALFIGALISGLTSSYALAEVTFRQEPISPIPLQLDINQAKARLGEQLFFDTRLSRDNQFSCASCHQLDAGGDDNVSSGLSISAEHHIINTPSIFNVRYNFRQNWDGSAETLHQQIDLVMSSAHEFDNKWTTVITTLSKDAQLRNDFKSVYADGITKNNIISAIVEFEKTLTTPNSRFDRYLRNEDDSLSDEEIKGYLTFKELGCVSCHQGINIGGNLYQKFGVFYDYLAERGDISEPDYGRMNATNRQMDKFVFKVPSLRNVAITAPYFHDGSVDTLEEAISVMGRTQLGRKLTTDDVFLIKQFLNTLTGEYKNTLLDVSL